MFQLDLLSLIPQSLKQTVRDVLVDFVADQAKKYASDELATKIKKLRSDAAFNKTFEEGLQQASRRFVEEYKVEDEDLVVAIATDKEFFENEEIQKALLAVLKKPSAYLGDERDTLFQSFDTVLPQRLNRERVNRAVIYLLRCLAEELWHMPELQPVYSLQFQRVTAEATREQIAIQKAQLQALTGLNAGIREALLQLTDAIAEKKPLPAGDTLALPAPPKPKVYHNLPQPDYGHFVGRDKELVQVARILRPYPHSQEHLVTIDGIGGIGKSALALEVAHRYLRNYDRIPVEERFEAIIWTSAKQTVLTAEGITIRRQVLRTLDDIYTAIAVALQREDITRARPEEQAEVVCQALTQQRTLLIVDNLETVDDETVLTFLRELPAPTKAIVTTRHRLDVAYPVRLVGMPWEDAQQLIAQECQKKEVILSNDEARRLYDRTGGVPLAVVWSIAQMGFGYGVDAVLARLGRPSSDIARFCFEGAMEHLKGKPAHNLLMSLSLFATDAGREALGFITDLSELDRDEGLVELERLSLVNKKGFRFQILPLTLAYSKAELSKEVELEPLYRGRLVDFLLRFLIEQSHHRYENLENVKLEMDNILSAMDWCWHTGKLDTFISFAEKMDIYLWLTGNWSAHLKYVGLGLEAAVVLDRKLAEANFLQVLTIIKQRQDNLDEAQNSIKTAIDIYQLNGDKNGLANSTYRLATLQILKQEYEAAKNNLYNTLKLAEEVGNKRLIARIQRGLALIEIAEGNYDSAEIYLKRARDLREQETPLSTGLSRTYRLLGQVSFLRQEYEVANRYFQQSLEIAEKVGSQQRIAEVKMDIAKLKVACGDIDDARLLVQQTSEIFTKLGLKRELREIQTLHDQISKVEE